MILGFIGDFLTFAGGVVLAVDAALEEQKLKKMRAWIETIEAPELAQVILSRQGIQLKTKDEVERSFIRQSARHAKIGMIVLSIGFLFLFSSRISEALHAAHETQQKLDPQAKSSDNRKCG